MAYITKYGDTLGGIATANKTTVPNLMQLNPTIKDPNKIMAGASLNLSAPATPTVPQISTATPPSMVAPATPTSTPTTPTVPNMGSLSTPPAPTISPAPSGGGGSYTVNSGDTLSAIAQKNGMSLSELLSNNPQFQSNPGLIKPGQTVNLNGTPSAPTVPQTSDGQSINPATGGVSAPSTPVAPAVPDLKSVLSDVDKYTNLSQEEIDNASQISNIRSGLGITVANEANRPIPLTFITGRQKAEEARALALEKPLTDQAALLQAQRIAKLDAAKSKLASVTPKSVSPGESLVDPISGKVIVSGQSLSDKNALDTFFNLTQTYPDAKITWNDSLSSQQNLAAAKSAVESSPSFQAKQTVYAINPLTGEPTIINKRVGSGTIGGGFTGSVTENNLAPELKGALSTINGVQYFDAGKVTSAQLPYLQRTAQQLGVPILAKEDANKVQEAFQSFSGANALITQITKLAGNVLTATSDPISQTTQAARLKAIELAPSISTDNDAKQFIAARNSMLSLLTRAAGEKGVLTNQDIARIAEAMPSYGDSSTLASEKAKNFSQVMNSVLQGAISAYIGTPSAGSGGGSYTGKTSSGLSYTVTQ